MAQHRRTTSKKQSASYEDYFMLELTVKRLTGIKRGIIPALGSKYYFKAGFTGDSKMLIGNPIAAKKGVVSWCTGASFRLQESPSRLPSRLRIEVYKSYMIGRDIYLGAFQGDLADSPEFFEMEDGGSLHIGVRTEAVENKPSLGLEFSVSQIHDRLITLPREGADDLNVLVRY